MKVKIRNFSLFSFVNFNKLSKLINSITRKKYLKLYQIPGCLNLDLNPCYSVSSTYPLFQVELYNYMETLKNDFELKKSYTTYKFGDGDYYFLEGIPIGSASPGKRAISRTLSRSELDSNIINSKKCDRYFCEIYPENRSKFYQLFGEQRDLLPAEFHYGLIANRWFFREFGDSIGIIGAQEKIELIKLLMKEPVYKEFLGLENFTDYIVVPQKFAADNVGELEKNLTQQLVHSKSRMFLFGVGHVKSSIAWRFKYMKPSIYLDIGSGIDAIAGLIDSKRPYFGGWTNYQVPKKYDYSILDLLQLQNSKIKNIN